MYVACNEIVAEEFAHDKWRKSKFGLLVAGVLFIGLIEVFLH